MRKLLAFTLAEVMITMTIVGVVAALTIPNLRYQRTKKEYSAKLKNFYSRMENSILDSETENGSFKDMYLPSSAAATYDWYFKFVDPYMGHSRVDKANSRVYFNDGSSIEFSKSDCADVNYDTNADRPPNRLGFDQYRFLFCFSNSTRGTYFNDETMFFGPYGKSLHTAGTSRANLVSTCQSEPKACSKLLQNDQWEFKDDYPYKF